MGRPYKSATPLRTAEVTTGDGVRLIVTHYRYTTTPDRAQVTRREWITHTRYTDGRRTAYDCEEFTGLRLNRIEKEWDEMLEVMRGAGNVTVNDADYTPARPATAERTRRRTQRPAAQRPAPAARFPRRRPETR